MTTTGITADPAEILRALAVLFDAGDVVELRVPKAGRHGTVSGFFTDFATLVREAVRWNDFTVYITLNPVQPALLSRRANRAETYADTLTSDGDILARRRLLMDFDPVRPAGIASTDGEHEAALIRAEQVRDALTAAGWPQPVLADSGNGAHLLYRIDLANDPDALKLVNGVLDALALQFDDGLVAVDRKVGNAARITKCYGTVARKGDDTPDRPHRLSRLIDVPAVVEVVPRELLKALAATVPQPEPAAFRGRVGGAAIDAGAWLAEHGIAVKFSGSWNSGTRFILTTCPWNAAHTNGAAYVLQFANGAIAAGCHHNGCIGKRWRDLRELFEPEAERRRSSTSAAEAGSKSSGSAKDTIGLTRRLAEAILAEVPMARDAGGLLYTHRRGTYRPDGRLVIKQRVITKVVEWHESPKWSPALATAVAEWIAPYAPELWERPPLEMLNVGNGVLVVTPDGPVLRPHTPDHLSPVQLSVAYDPAARCPAWDAFIGDVFPADCRALAWQLVAWLMLPDTSIQTAMLLVGEGSNGKSTFLKALTAFLGRENVANLNLQRLETDKFSVARLVGKLANICADLPSLRLEQSSMFKAITGGDRVTAERKGQDAFEFVPYSRLVFSANHLPSTNDASIAFFRRWTVVPFTASFPNDPAKAKALDGALTAPAELSGLLNRAITALPELRAHGFTESDSMRAAAEEFRATTDPLAVWLDQETVLLSSAYIPKAALLAAYQRECDRKGRPSPTATGFSLAIKRLRPMLGEGQRTVADRPQHCWLGLALRLTDPPPGSRSSGANPSQTPPQSPPDPPSDSQGSQGSQGCLHSTGDFSSDAAAHTHGSASPNDTEATNGHDGDAGGLGGTAAPAGAEDWGSDAAQPAGTTAIEFSQQNASNPVNPVNPVSEQADCGVPDPLPCRALGCQKLAADARGFCAADRARADLLDHGAKVGWPSLAGDPGSGEVAWRAWAQSCDLPMVELVLGLARREHPIPTNARSTEGAADASV